MVEIFFINKTTLEKKLTMIVKKHVYEVVNLHTIFLSMFCGMIAFCFMICLSFGTL